MVRIKDAAEVMAFDTGSMQLFVRADDRTLTLLRRVLPLTLPRRTVHHRRR